MQNQAATFGLCGCSGIVSDKEQPKLARYLTVMGTERRIAESME